MKADTKEKINALVDATFPPKDREGHVDDNTLERNRLRTRIAALVRCIAQGYER
jgi:hypothetical protein